MPTSDHPTALIAPLVRRNVGLNQRKEQRKMSEHKLWHGIFLPAVIAAVTAFAVAFFQSERDRQLAREERHVTILKEDLRSMIDLASEIESLAIKLPNNRRFTRQDLLALKTQQSVLDQINRTADSLHQVDIDGLRDKAFSRRDYLTDRVSASTKEVMDTTVSLRRALHQAVFIFSDDVSVALATAHDSLNNYKVDIGGIDATDAGSQETKEDMTLDKNLADAVLRMRAQIDQVGKEIKGKGN